MADKQSREVGELHVKVDVDVSEALTGLKALQREAREATKALRELGDAQKRSQALPRVPFVGHPDTPEDNTSDWLEKAYDNISRKIDEAEAAKSIADDIRRRYEIGGRGE